MDFSSDEQVEAALSAAAAQDASESDPFADGLGEQAPAATQPAGAPEGSTPDSGAAQPEAPAPAEDTFDGGQFNPDNLPPELQPAWKQLQAAYTQKTQGLAEAMKQYEALGDVDPAQLQQARALLGRIQDPSGWLELHGELTNALRQYGMMPEDADAFATEALTGTHDELPDFSELDDPELASLADRLAKAEERISDFDAEREFRQEAEQAERLHTALVGEFNRQESIIRQNNPDYDEDDLDAIYELADHFNGNLLEAQKRYEAHSNRRIERWFAQKEGASSQPGTQPAPSGAGTPSTAEAEPKTIEEAAAEAEELLRRLQDAGEIDLTF